MKRRIVTKYPGFCRVCNRAIEEGKEVYFEKGKGIWHLACNSPDASTVPRKYLYASLVVIIILLAALVGSLTVTKPPNLIVSTVTVTQMFTEPVTL